MPGGLYGLLPGIHVVSDFLTLVCLPHSAAEISGLLSIGADVPVFRVVQQRKGLKYAEREYWDALGKAHARSTTWISWEPVMKRSLAQLQDLSKRRQAELRKAQAPALRFLGDNGSIIVAHVKDAQKGLGSVRRTPQRRVRRGGVFRPFGRILGRLSHTFVKH